MPTRSQKLLRIFKETIGVPSVGAEVGVQFGKNAQALLDAYPRMKLYLVDCYDDSLFRCHQSKTAAEVQAEARKKLGPYFERVVWNIMRSSVAASCVKGGELDFVFIDASHDYDNVKADIDAWSLKIRPGGIIAGHDYSPRFRGVRRIVSERFPNHKNTGDVWWAQL